jgi:hypothetical protein
MAAKKPVATTPNPQLDLLKSELEAHDIRIASANSVTECLIDDATNGISPFS